MEQVIHNNLTTKDNKLIMMLTLPMTNHMVNKMTIYKEDGDSKKLKSKHNLRMKEKNLIDSKNSMILMSYNMTNKLEL